MSHKEEEGEKVERSLALTGQRRTVRRDENRVQHEVKGDISCILPPLSNDRRRFDEESVFTRIEDEG